MIQQTYRPAALVGPVVRTVVGLGKQVLRVKAFGLNPPWWLKWTVVPFSVSTSWPLVVSVPADIVSIYATHEAKDFFLTSDIPEIVAIRNAIQKTQRVAEAMVYLAFDGYTELYDALGKYLEDSTVVSADGEIVVTVPQVWFVDP